MNRRQLQSTLFKTKWPPITLAIVTEVCSLHRNRKIIIEYSRTQIIAIIFKAANWGLAWNFEQMVAKAYFFPIECFPLMEPALKPISVRVSRYKKLKIWILAQGFRGVEIYNLREFKLEEIRYYSIIEIANISYFDMVVKKNTQIIYFIAQPKSVKLICLQYLENFLKFQRLFAYWY